MNEIVAKLVELKTSPLEKKLVLLPEDWAVLENIVVLEMENNIVENCASSRLVPDEIADQVYRLVDEATPGWDDRQTVANFLLFEMSKLRRRLQFEQHAQNVIDAHVGTTYTRCNETLANANMCALKRCSDTNKFIVFKNSCKQ